MKKISLYILIILSLIIITGCNDKVNDFARKEAIFECYDLDGDGHSQNVTLTYEDENGTRIFYDGETKIGTRIDAIHYAQSKTNGMTCKPGSDRNNN